MHAARRLRISVRQAAKHDGSTLKGFPAAPAVLARVADSTRRLHPVQGLARVRSSADVNASRARLEPDNMSCFRESAAEVGILAIEEEAIVEAAHLLQGSAAEHDAGA